MRHFATTVFFLLFVLINVNAQPCSGSGIQTGSDIVFCDGSYSLTQTIPNIPAGNYVRLYVCSANTYTLSTCTNTLPGSDSEISVLDDAGGVITDAATDYINANTCGTSGNDETLVWTPPAAYAGGGFVWVVVTQYDIILGACQNAGVTSELTITASGTCAQPGSCCDYPVNVSADSYATGVQTTCEFSNDYDDTQVSCAAENFYMNGDDYVIAFTPTTGGYYEFEFTAIDNWMGFFILNGCPSTGGGCVFNDGIGNPGTVIHNVQLTGGVTYFIIIGSNPGGVSPPGTQCGDFELNINPTPDGVICEVPVMLSDGPYPINVVGQTTCGFGDDYDTSNCSNDNYIGGEDMVFTITPSTSGCYRVSLTAESFSSVLILDDCPDSGGACIGWAGSAAADPTLDVTLNAGTTYYIIVSSWPAPDCVPFDLEIDQCPVGSVCSDPFLIASAPFNQTGLTTCGLANDYSTGVCDATYLAGEDWVATFTPATSGCYTVDLTGTNPGASIMIMDACPDAGGVNCIGWDGSAAANPTANGYLEAGTTYYFVVSSDAGCTAFDLDLQECSQDGEDCTNALTLTTGASQNLTTCGTGDNYDQNDGCGSTFMNGEEIVLEYTPATDGCYDLVVSAASDPTANFGLFVLDDCPDVAMVDCIAQGETIASTPTVTANLTGGTTYTIVVASSGCSDFTIVANSVSCPLGNTCANPQPVVLGSNGEYDMSASGDDYDPGDACGGDFMGGNDFVMEFTPGTTDCYNFMTSAGTGSNPDADLGIFILDGCPDAAGTNCIASATLENGFPEVDATLNMGETYFIVIGAIEYLSPVLYSNSTTVFNLDIATGGTNCPSGANCGNPLVVNVGMYPDLTSCGFGNDYGNGDGCSSSYMIGEDLVMEFTPAVSDCYDFITSANANSDPTDDLGLFVLDNCPDAPGAACLVNETVENGFPSGSANLDAGTTYYILVTGVQQAGVVVVSDCADGFDFEIVAGGSCPVGLDCSDPFNITLGTYNDLTSCGAIDDYGSGDGCGSLYMVGEDVVFTFTPPVTDCYNIATSATPTSDPIADVGLFVLDDCPDAPGVNCLMSESQDNGFPSGDVELNGGQTYYIIFSAVDIDDAGAVLIYNEYCTDFNISISTSTACPVAPNDCPFDATDITPLISSAISQPHGWECDPSLQIFSDGVSPPTNTNVVGDVVSIPCDISSDIGDRNDIWYKFTMDASFDAWIDLYQNQGSDLVTLVYEAAPGGISGDCFGVDGLSYVGCADDSNGLDPVYDVGDCTVVIHNRFDISTLTPGTEYYVRIIVDNGGPGTGAIDFNLCVEQGFTVDGASDGCDDLPDGGSTPQIACPTGEANVNIDTTLFNQSNVGAFGNEPAGCDPDQGVLATAAGDGDIGCTGAFGPAAYINNVVNNNVHYSFEVNADAGCLLGAEVTITFTNAFSNGGAFQVQVVEGVCPSGGSAVMALSTDPPGNGCFAMQEFLPNGQYYIVVDGQDGALLGYDLQVEIVYDGPMCELGCCYPPPANDPMDLMECDDGLGSFNFNLTSLNNDINGGSGDQVNWYEDMAGTMPIADPSNYTATTGTTTVYATVFDGTCESDPVAIDLILFESPTIDNINATDATCGLMNGELEVEVSGGSTPYSVDIGGTPMTGNGPTFTFTGLTSGSYTATVSDDNGCTTTQVATINDNPGPTISVVVTDAMCGADGEIEVTVSSGTSPFTVDIGGGNTQTGIGPVFTFTGLTAGNYDVDVEDANLCNTLENVTLGQSPGPVIDNINASNSTCGNSDGSAQVTITGDDPPFTVEINSMVETGNSPVTVNGLPAGTYDVLVTDNNGCTVMGSVTISDDSGPSIDMVTPTDATCGNDDGSAVVTITGNGDFTVTINGQSATGPSPVNVTGLSPGMHSVDVEDINGCVTSSSITIGQQESPTIGTITPACDGTDGTATVNISGGTEPYDVTIDGNMVSGNSPLTVTGLTEGTYDVFVVDDNGCADTSSVIIPDCAMCDIDAVVTDILCDDNGTPSDPSDDTFTFNVTVSGMDTGASWTADDPNSETGAYDVSVNFGPYNIADGDLNFTITDIDDPACTADVMVTAPATCSDLCDIDNVVANILCNDNGTPTDPSDDTFTFDVTVSGSNTGATWTANDPNGETGAYDVAVGFGPYNIADGNLSFTITDVDDPACTTNVMVTPPATCSDQCDITAVASNILCDDNGTPSDPSDDTYTFDLTVSGDNTATGWSADDAGMTTGTYDVAVNFGPFNIADGDQTITVTDDEDPACTDVVTIPAPAPCSGTCSIANSVTNIVCDDNGTPSDPSDDTFTFEVTVSGSNTGATWTADDPLSTTGTYDIAESFGPYNIADGDLNFTITDIDDPACTTDVMVSAPATCSDLCDITAVASNIVCDDNGTPSDPGDDTFTFDITVSGDNTSSGWTADDAGTTTGAYDVAIGFGPFNIADGDLTITITDNNDPACTDMVTIVAPPTCSNTCDIDAIVANIICDDNGTPSDPGDDTFTFDITVSGSNTGASWTSDDPNSETGAYDVAVNFGPYNIADGDLNFTITDIDDLACTADVMVTAPATCSDLCDIDNVVANILCNDNGTPTDPSDDTFTFDVTVSGSNTGATWTANDPNGETGAYDVAVGFGPYNIADGNLSFTITDVDDPACTTNVMVTPPATCSDQCDITAVASNILCDDNGTPSDPSDDTYTFDITVSGDNTATGWSADDAGMTTGTYDVAVNFGPFNIADGDQTITVTDDDDPACTDVVTIPAPAPCSGTCSIANSVTNIVCDDNGTPSDPSDDTFTFEVTVSGSNTGATWTADDPLSTTGAYDIAESFGPYNIADGDLNFTITDIDDPACTTDVMVSAPATCSDLCDITAVTGNIVCDDNGTPSDPGDDTFTFDITVSGDNTSSGWTADDAGTTTGAYDVAISFGPFNIADGDLTITITDNNDPACTDMVTIVAPPTCSNTCDIDAIVANIICDDNGTPSDPGDDTFTFDITVSGSNTGATWSAGNPINAIGDYDVTINLGPYNIADGDLNFTVTDVDDLTCTVDVMVSEPATCSDLCDIDNVVANILCNDNGTPTDPSDDTFTFDVTVSGSNTGATWTANDPNGETGAYDVAVGFGPYNIADGNLSFTITDVDDPACTTNVMVTPPATCSDQCDITAVASNILCDDNGTPSDPSDDTYTFDITVSGDNTATGWSADDAGTTTGTYDVAVNFGPFNIADGDQTITVTDDDDPMCTDVVTITAPAPCSGTCSIGNSVTNIICDDNGTPSDPSDDTFTFEVTVSGSNTGATWTADDPLSTTGAYDIAESFGPYNIADGDLNFTITDIDDPACTTDVIVIAPATCSDLCNITAVAGNIVCDDNGTPSDPGDDTFTFDITVSGDNTSSGWTADDAGTTTGAYDVAVSFGPFNIADGDLTITITDNNDPACTDVLVITAPPSCSDECMISAMVSNILCDNGGTPNDLSDDTYSFDVIVTGSNTATGFNANDPNTTTGNYNETVNFGPYNSNAGDVSFTITDNDDPLCTTDISVEAPGPMINSVTPTNSTCGNNDGTVEVEVSGDAPFTVTIDGNSSSGDSPLTVNGLAAGTYSVFASDAAGCVVESTVTIEDTPGPTIDMVTPSDASCLGSDGEAEVTISGGTSPYTVTINLISETGESPITITGLAPGSYNVDVVDANGCTVTGLVTIDEQQSPVIEDIDVTNSTCGNADGEATVTISGGLAPYTVDIDSQSETGANPVTVANLPAGTYDVTVTDDNGCTATSTVTISDDGGPVIEAITPSNEVCGNGAGSAEVVISGGLAPYSVTIGTESASGDSPITINNLPAGTYSVDIVDDNGCMTSGTVTIDETPGPTISSVDITNEICGMTNGALTINLTDGTAPYTYDIGVGTPQVDDNTFTGLAAGTYTILVTDANGCTDEASATINNIPGVMIEDTDITDASCGLDNGQVTITISGGTGPFSYDLSGTIQVNNGTFTDLAEGGYDLIVTDDNGCTAEANITIGGSPGIEISSIDPTDENCGNADGSATINISGGTAPVTYTLDGNIQVDDNIFTGLAAGTYDVNVEDANGCTAMAAITIDEIEGPVIDDIITIDASCGQPDGQATIMVSGGSTPYSYDLDGNIQIDPNNTFTGLASGSYTIIVTDDNGCTVMGTVNINDSDGPSIDNVDITDANCDMATGSVTVTASGGMPPLTISLDGNVNGTNTFNDLLPGNYTVAVEDDNGCITTQTITVGNIPGVQIDDITTIEATCGNSDGSKTVFFSGGSAPYSVTCGVNTQTTSDNSVTFVNLPAGTYSVMVTDVNGCTDQGTATIDEAEAPIINNIVVDDADCGMSTGSLTVNASGGTAPLNYDIGNGAQTSNVFNDLPSGTYTVIVTDANGCTDESTATINDIPGVQIDNIQTTEATCGNADGTKTINVSGGTPPYTYDCNGVIQIGNNVYTDLPAGTYTVIVTDAAGCTDMQTATISDADGPEIINIDIIDASCGLSNAEVTISANGGTAPYTYFINGTPQSGNVFSDLPSGDIVILVEDANGCSVSQNEVIGDTPPVTIDNLIVTDANCGQNDGEVIVLLGGGTAPFTYILDGVSQTSNNTFIGLLAGTYPLDIIDAQGCTATGSVTIQDLPGVLINDLTIVESSCGLANGSITVNTSGGTPPYTYQINLGTPQASNLFSNLASGTYEIMVTDDNGCTDTANAVINGTDGPSIDDVSTTPSNCGQADGSVTISASGGTTPYSYNLDGIIQSDPDNTFIDLASGNYPITVTDANGCTATATANVTDDGGASIDDVNIIDANCGMPNGMLTIFASGGTAPLTYLLNGNNSGSNVFDNLIPNTYNIEVIDANGCITTASVIVGNIPGVQIDDILTTPETCNQMDGSKTIIVSGGTEPYTFECNGIIQTSGVFNNLSAGTYTVIVTDADGCVDEGSATIGVLEGPLITNIEPTNASCGLDNGALVVNVVDGTQPYSYDIGNGQQSSNQFINLSAGSYVVTVTDDNGCTDTQQTTINDSPGVMIDNVIITNSTCGQADGAKEVLVSGGTAPFTFDCNGTIQDNGIFTNLPAGIYTVIVTDANGCSDSTTANISDEDGPIIDDLSSTPANCGNADGSITVTISGGIAPYQVSAGGQMVSTSDVATISDLPAGSTSVLIEDANGCSVSGSINIESTPGVVIDDIIITDATCGQADGAKEVIISGGTAPYSYDCNGTVQDNGIFNNLPSGSYTVIVTDANGCTDMATAEIMDEDGPLIDSAVATETSCGQNDGSVTISISQGLSPYEVSLDGTTQTTTGTVSFTDLSPGNYSFDVVDANGCATSGSIVVEGSDNPVIDNIMVQDASCNNSDGSLTVQVSLGTAPYMYDIGNGPQSSNVFENLPSGSYTVIVTDNNGCSAQLDTAINDIGGPTITDITVVDASSAGDDGSITVTASGGTPPYTFNVNNVDLISDSSVTFENLGEGTYLITVTDANGCVTTGMATIVNGDCVTIDAINTSNAICDQNNGAITIFASGGVEPYMYSIDNGPLQSSNLFMGVGQGSYLITVIDDAGCTSTQTVEIVQNGSPSISNVIVVDATCGENNGDISITATDGLPPYSYSVNGITFQDNPNFSNLQANTYDIIVEDDNGCQVTQQVVIENLTMPIVDDLIIVNATCGDMDGSVTFIVSGAIGQVQYAINGGAFQGSNLFENLEAGAYTYQILDDNCLVEGVLAITNEGAPEISDIDITNATCNSADGEVTISIIPGTAPHTYTLGNITQIDNPTFTGLPAGQYTIVVEDANGCIGSEVFEIIEQGELDINIIGNLFVCEDGFTELMAEPLDQGYDFIWSIDGITTTNLLVTADNAGTITLTATKGDCVGTALVDVTLVPLPIAEAGNAQELNCNNPSVTLDASASTGTDITFLWSTMDGNIIGDPDQASIEVNSTGTYQVLITEGINGCSSTDIVVVSQANDVPNAEAGPGGTLDCDNTTYSLNGNGSSQGSNYSYEWTGDNNQTIINPNTLTPTVSQIGLYTLQVTDNTSGCTAIDVVEVTADESLPSGISLDLVNPDCFGDSNGSIAILDVQGGQGPYQYSFGGGAFADRTEFDNLSAGTYNIIVMAANGCQYTETVVVDDGINLTVDLGPDQFIDFGDIANINAVTNEDIANIVDVQWSISPEDEELCATCLDQTLMPPVTTFFILDITNDKGCTAQDNLTVFVHLEQTIHVPNIFSPDGDGINDIFYITTEENVEARINHMRVLDRWGNLVFNNENFEPNNPLDGWDGTWDGKRLAPQVFVYVIEVEFTLETEVKTQLFKGDITIKN